MKHINGAGGIDSSLLLAMKDIEKNRESLKKTQRLAGVGGFEFIPEDKVIVLSEEACFALGLPEDKAVYNLEELCAMIVSGMDCKFCTLLENCSDGKSGATLEFIIKDKDKKKRYIEVAFDNPDPVMQGNVSGVFCNVTQKKSAELRGSVHSQAFDAVFTKTKLAILVLNLKGDIINFNSSALDLFGYSEQEMARMHSRKLLMEEDLIEASRIFARFINSAGKLNSLEYRLKKKDGGIIDVLVNFDMIVGTDGEKIYIFINDITDMKEMERRHLDQERVLIQQSKMATLGEMVGIIAHQWQQPINSIAMIVQMLQELLDVDEENSKMLAKSVDSVMAQVSFMSNTMNDFRNFLKPSEICSDYNVYRVVKEVLNLYRPQLRHFSIDCDIQVNDEHVKKAEVNGYENELKNVILNFLTNARDAIEESQCSKGCITVTLRETTDTVIISIEDNGGGIKDEVIERMFEPYVSTKGDKGTGLGLYMAKLIIIDRMGGDIKIKNVDDGLRVDVILKKVN